MEQDGGNNHLMDLSRWMVQTPFKLLQPSATILQYEGFCPKMGLLLV